MTLSYNNLGVAYSHLRQYSKAKENHEKALTITKEIYDEKHNIVAQSYSNLGCTYSDLNQYHLANECFHKALNIYKTVYGEQHAEVERTYQNLRIVKMRQVEEVLRPYNICCQEHYYYNLNLSWQFYPTI